MKTRILLLFGGLAAGLAIGALLGWVVWPVEYYDTEFSVLHPTFKLEYATMVGAAYELDGDWDRASARLAVLQEEDVACLAPRPDPPRHCRRP